MPELTPQFIPPPLTPEERAAQEQLRQSAGQIREIRDQLWTLHGQLGEQPEESDMAEGRRPWSVAFSIRGTIECVVVDDLDPAVRSLEETGQETPLGLIRDFEERGARSRPASRRPVTPGEPLLIREAEHADLDAVYQLGLSLPELQPSATSRFLDFEELPELLTHGLLLVAIGAREELAGFLYAEIYHKLGYVALLAVAPAYRRRGVANALLEDCAVRFRPDGVRRLGGFANLGGGIVAFLASQGFIPGKSFVWMDRQI